MLTAMRRRARRVVARGRVELEPAGSTPESVPAVPVAAAAVGAAAAAGSAPAVGAAAAVGAAGTAPAAAPDDPAAERRATLRRRLAVGVVLTAVYMVLLDASIVNVAIPSIRTNLGAGFAEAQLVIAGYSVAYAACLITGGRLGDIYGRRRMFLIGMSVFVGASALCGLAQSATMLIGSRILQGAAGALMYPQAFAVVQLSYPPHRRAAAFGLLGSVVGLAVISGPLFGGLIIGDRIAGDSWRWVFLVNLPVGLVSMAAATRLVPQLRAPDRPRLDIAGTVTAGAALALLVLPLVEGRDAGWPAWAFACLALAAMAAAGFVAVERACARRGGAPLVPLHLFVARGFAGGLVATILLFVAIPSFFFALPIVLQLGLHFSALHSGLTVVPFSVMLAITSTVAIRFAPRLGRRLPVAGALLLGLAMLGVAITLALRGAALTSLDLVPALLLGGVGAGATMGPLFSAALRSVPVQLAGAASGVLSTAQQVGTALGISVVGAVFFGAVSTPLTASGLVAALRGAVFVNMSAALLAATVVLLLRERAAAAPVPAPVPARAGGEPEG